MSLWTPGGEHEVPRDEPGRGPGGEPGGESGSEPSIEDLSPEERARLEEVAGQMADVRRQLLSVPASTVIANHVMGFYELAAIHLSAEPPNLDEAQVAIDAMGGVVEGVEGRLGENEPVLRDALAQLRLAFVQVRAAVEGDEPGDD